MAPQGWRGHCQSIWSAWDGNFTGDPTVSAPNRPSPPISYQPSFFIRSGAETQPWRPSCWKRRRRRKRRNSSCSRSDLCSLAGGGICSPGECLILGVCNAVVPELAAQGQDSVPRCPTVSPGAEPPHEVALSNQECEAVPGSHRAPHFSNGLVIHSSN